MVQIKKDALVVTITTEAPLEQLLVFKNSLQRVLRFINPEEVETNSGLIYDMQNVLDLASALEFESEQIQQISLALTGKKSPLDYLHVH